jgi:hypothetical protein
MQERSYPEDQTRLWSKIQKGGPLPVHDPSLGPCWLWLAGKNNGGYGHFRGWDGRMIVAHRLTYEMLVGPIPDGLHIDHLCRVRGCVNPSHLDPVLTKVNTWRGLKGVMKTHCIHGHAFSPENTWTYRGHRVCKVCSRARRTEYDRRNYVDLYAKKKARKVSL